MDNVCYLPLFAATAILYCQFPSLVMYGHPASVPSSSAALSTLFVTSKVPCQALSAEVLFDIIFNLAFLLIIIGGIVFIVSPLFGLTSFTVADEKSNHFLPIFRSASLVALVPSVKTCAC